MQMSFIRLFHAPGDDDPIIPSSGTEDLPEDSDDTSEVEEPEAAPSDEEPFMDKVKDALQDWSNQDQADQDFDDTRV